MPHKTIIRLLCVARNPANGFPARLLEERQKKLASFGSDPDWRKQVAEETEQHGVVVARTHNIMLQPTPYCPEAKIAGNVQELRIYEAMPGRLPDLHNRFANHTLGFFKKYGMENVGPK